MTREFRKVLFEQVEIYPVTCERLSGGRSNLEVLDGVIRGGARIIQLREKEYSTRKFFQLAVEFRKITSAAGVLLIINDRLDIALAAKADGVHLGQDDLPIAIARTLAPELLIGVSTHSLGEAVQAQRDGADYINIGPIFPTTTKEGIETFLGPEAIAAISPSIDIPFTVMGGINAHNMDQALSHGARRLAMVTAVTQAADIAAVVSSLRERIRTYGSDSP